MANPLRWGILSAGNISHDFVNSIATLNPEEHKVVAVAARNLSKAQAFADKHGIPKAYSSYESVAKDTTVDVVYVGAINPTHLELCKTVINAGKHVLCEKPLAMNVRETKEIIELAKEKNVFLMEAVWPRFLPAYMRLHEEIERGAIGKVWQITASFGWKETRDRVAKMELGGGTVIDMGIYCVQLACFIFKERPEKIVAVGSTNEEGCDEAVSFTLYYKDGRMGSFNTHTKVNLPCEAQIFGTEGNMTMPFPMWSSFKLVMPGGETIEWPHPKGNRHPFCYPNSVGLRFEAAHVRECLQKGLKESPVVPWKETILLAEIMEDVRKQVGVIYPQDRK